jgi:hypothetical protein
MCRNLTGPDLAARVVGDVSAVEASGVRAAHFTVAGVLEVPDDSRLNLPGAFTLIAWVRPDTQPASGGRIIDRITPGAEDGFLLDTIPVIPSGSH